MGSETGDEGAAVNIAEGHGEQPVVFCVVDFESAVWGEAVGWVFSVEYGGERDNKLFRLDGTQVCSDNTC